MSALEEKTEEPPLNVERQLQLLLEEVGLDSVPVDPSSLEALKQFVASDDYSFNVSISAEGTESSLEARAPPVSEVEPHPELKRYTSELTTPSADSLGSPLEEESSVAVAGSFVHVEGASPVENQILETLHRQTRLLLEMQRRIDDLTTTVEHLSGGGIQPISATMNRSAPVERPGRINYTQPKPAVTAAPPTRPAAGQTPRTVDPVQPRNNDNNAGNRRGGILTKIRNSRLFKICLVFVSLRRHYGVEGMDGGLILKTIVMMAILFARLSSSRSSHRHDDVELQAKFAFLTLMITIGFLAHTGYLKYLYVFCVKENFPGRIWAGEDADEIIRNAGRTPAPAGNNNNHRDLANNIAAGGAHAPAVPQGHIPPAQGLAGGNNGNAGGGWRETFFAGVIPEAGHGLVGALQDVALLFGSLFMSIFPMWYPAEPPRPRQQQQQPPPQQQQEMAAPGAVLPPREVMEPADESDDE